MKLLSLIFCLFVYSQEAVHISDMDTFDEEMYTEHSELEVDTTYILKRVNKIRARGCRCGNEWVSPSNPVVWNKALETTAHEHAREMSKYRFFSHKSRDGKNVGQRLDDAGYKWRYAGENIAEGQKDFDEVLYDWIESYTHCKMLMNPKMEEMGVARSGKYWVQHFGTRMPDKTVRKKIYYREG